MSICKTFPKSLRFYREANGMSQEQLAAASALDRTYISQLERGLKSPTLHSLDKIAACLNVPAEALIQTSRDSATLRVATDYITREQSHVAISRHDESLRILTANLLSAVDIAHGLIDDMYSSDLDIASILGMRNLSAFVGELLAVGVVRACNGLFRSNPHQDGYPDLLVMDEIGKQNWKDLSNRVDEKAPFSPFPSGGIEVKATCGSVPTPAVCRRRGFTKPSIGDSRIGCMSGYDWKAHHRETNNLLGILWDFIDRRPRIAAMFYSDVLNENDWGKIVQPRTGGGRTTSVSIMGRPYIKNV